MEFNIEKSTLEKINNYVKKLKKSVFLVIFYTVLSLILLITLLVFGKKLFRKSTNDLEYALSIFTVSVVGISFFIKSIKKIRFIKLIKKDLDKKEVEFLSALPCDYGLSYDMFDYDRSGYTLIKDGYCLSLYFLNDKIKLLIIHDFKFIHKKKVFNAIENKIMHKEYNLYYLPKSKIVVSGDNEIKKVLKDRYY